MTGWLLAVVLWLAFNGALLLFSRLLFGPEAADEDVWVEWQQELSRSASETSMRQHPAGGQR